MDYAAAARRYRLLGRAVRGARNSICAKFLYGLKAARRAARAANSARSPQLPLALPQRRRLARSPLNKSHLPMINAAKPQVSYLLLDRKQGYSVAS